MKLGEECKFYYYDSGYSCGVKRKKTDNSSIDSDTVHRYCWGYHYAECPLYKDRHRYFDNLGNDEYEASGGWCFLTSACVEAKGLPDDCRELTVLRQFRDGYLRKTPQGAKEIDEYYLLAPRIVNAINTERDPTIVFEEIYKELIQPCVQWIERGENELAYMKYKIYVRSLQEKYL